MGKKTHNNTRGNSSHQGYLWPTVRLTLQKANNSLVLSCCASIIPLFFNLASRAAGSGISSLFLLSLTLLFRLLVNGKLARSADVRWVKIKPGWLCIIRKKARSNRLNDCICTGNIIWIFIRLKKCEIHEGKFQVKLVWSKFTWIDFKIVVLLPDYKLN